MAASMVSLRRSVLLALAAGLAIAALVAIVAIVTRSFDQTDLRVVATSLGFSIFSALGAVGARTERRATAFGALGTSTTAGAGLSFVLLLVALWGNDAPSVLRGFGTVAVATLAGSHACLVLGARRANDSSLVAGLTVASIASASIDALLGGLAITGVTTRVNSNYVRLLAVLVIAVLLTTVLPPILRRLSTPADQEPVGDAATAPVARPFDPLATDLLAVAATLDRLVPHAGDAAAQIQNEAAQLRRIAGAS
jgi:hypothetical protein